jgi:hypothetical protein
MDDGITLCIHGWHKRQFKSDDVSERSRNSMKRSRERSKPDAVNVHVNAPDTDTDTEREKDSPLPSQNSLGPEYEPVGHLATSLGNDVAYGPWVMHQGKLGRPAAWIEYAIRHCPPERFSPRYLEGMLRSYDRNGLPKDANGALPKPLERLTVTNKTPKQAADEAMARAMATAEQSRQEGLAQKKKPT